jgi:hypothetical protein
MRHKQPYACRNKKAGRRRGDPAENVPQDWQVSVFKI